MELRQLRFGPWGPWKSVRWDGFAHGLNLVEIPTQLDSRVAASLFALPRANQARPVTPPDESDEPFVVWEGGDGSESRLRLQFNLIEPDLLVGRPTVPRLEVHQTRDPSPIDDPGQFISTLCADIDARCLPGLYRQR